MAVSYQGAEDVISILQRAQVRHDHVKNRSSVSRSAGDAGRDSGTDVASLCRHVCRGRAAVDPSGEAAAATAFTDILFGAERAAADGRERAAVVAVYGGFTYIAAGKRHRLPETSYNLIASDTP